PAWPLARPRFAMIEVLSQVSSVITISSQDGGVHCLVLVQLPISAGFDRQSEPYQCRFLEVAPDQHQADRQIIDAAAWHGEGGMPGNVERAGICLHVERGIDRGVERRVARRDRRR